MDNDPSIPPNYLQSGLKYNKVKVLEWLSQRPDLNLIENMWVALKGKALKGARRPASLTQLHQFCQEDWAKMPTNYCRKLVEGYLKHLAQVKQ